MSHSRAFTSWLAPQFERFVALRRASGYVYLSQARILRAFDRYLVEHAGSSPLNEQIPSNYMTSLDHLSPRSWNNVIAVVWPALAYARRHGADVEVLPELPPRLFRYWRQREPRILSSDEIKSLLEAARQLPPAGSLRPATATTLIGLLYTTGLRIGEALALDVGDIDQGDRLLTVRKGKFGKSRALPLRASTLAALNRYLDHPCRQVSTGSSNPFFVSSYRRRLADPTASSSFRDACVASGIPKPWPRRHDLRHTFAIDRVTTWYAQGVDVSARLPALSTYLGHVSIENTRLYLRANGQLLQEAASRFASQTSMLDQVRP